MHGSKPQSSGGWPWLTADMLICSRKMSGRLIETRDVVAYLRTYRSYTYTSMCVRVRANMCTRELVLDRARDARMAEDIDHGG